MHYETYSLGRVLTVTDPLNHTDSFTYDSLGRITTVTDKNGNITKYFYDQNGNIVETKDALNHSSYFEYDAMNRLVKVRLYRVDPQDNVTNEEQITLYQYDKRGLVKKEINAQSKETVYVYDGNGNMISKTDADSYTTNYVYDFKNLVETINYQGGKTVNFQYNKNGELVKMIDWNGTTTIALDALDRITSVNDHNSKLTKYTYDSVGNQVTMTYPDNTIVTNTYDLLGRLTNVKDAENQNTVYAYDAASQLLAQNYPNGRKHEHEYDDAGRLIQTFEHDPTNTPVKTLRFEFTYDAQGNLLENFRKGVGEGRVNEYFTYQYDVLNRLTEAKMYSFDPNINPSANPNYTHNYTYDSLGNLTFEQSGPNKTVDYKHNSLNQMVSKIVDNHPNQYYTYTYDNRGNLIKGTFHKNANQTEIAEQYTYDATNRMTKGTNDIGETSEYAYNGLGYLVKNVWTVKQNAYGYTGITVPQIEATLGEDLLVISDPAPTNSKNKKNKMTPDQVASGGGNINKTTVVTKNYVLDYTSPLQHAIMETETGGFTYRYVYGLQKLSVLISPVNKGGGSLVQNKQVKLWYHIDRLGSVDYMSDNVSGKVASYIDYDEWGLPLKKNVLKLDARELDMAIDYTGHAWDAVLGVYYAKARMYDAADRRFMAVDPVRGFIDAPQALVLYVYCLNNPVIQLLRCQLKYGLEQRQAGLLQRFNRL